MSNHPTSGRRMSYPPQSPQSATIIPAHTVRHAATTLVVAAAAVAEDGNQNRQNVGHLHGTRPKAKNVLGFKTGEGEGV